MFAICKIMSEIILQEHAGYSVSDLFRSSAFCGVYTTFVIIIEL